MAGVPASKAPAPPLRPLHGPRYVISHDGQRASVEVGGVPVRFLTGLSIAIEPGELPSLRMTFGASGGDVVLDDARLIVDAVDLPEPVARAMYEHLRARFQREHDDAARLYPQEMET